MYNLVDLSLSGGGGGGGGGSLEPREPDLATTLGFILGFGSTHL